MQAQASTLNAPTPRFNTVFLKRNKNTAIFAKEITAKAPTCLKDESDDTYWIIEKDLGLIPEKQKKTYMYLKLPF